MSYSIMSHYLIRSPLLPIERRNKVKGASSFEGKVAFLEDVLDDEVFVEAIEWGSPALYSQVCKFRDGCNRNDETSIDKLYYSVLKYYLRALYLYMSNYNDFDLDIRSTQNAGSVGPQSVPLTNFTCNCTTGVVCYATNLLCTPGNICDITMGCTDGCSEGCEPGEPSETHSYCGAACR